MSSNFEEVVRKIIAQENLEKLSDSVGWPEVRKIRRALESKSMTAEQAVDGFLTLRSSYRDKAKDKNFKKEMAKIIH